jgi:hypothetical protein
MVVNFPYYILLAGKGKRKGRERKGKRRRKERERKGKEKERWHLQSILSVQVPHTTCLE